MRFVGASHKYAYFATTTLLLCLNVCGCRSDTDSVKLLSGPVSLNRDSLRWFGGSSSIGPARASRWRSERLRARALPLPRPLGAWSDAPLRLSGVLMHAKTRGRAAEAALRGSEGELRCFEACLNAPGAAPGRY